MDKHQKDLDNITLQFFANSLYNVDLEKKQIVISLYKKKNFIRKE